MNDLSTLVEQFLAAYNDFYPHNASFLLGLHAYDGRVPDFSADSIAGWKQRLAGFKQQLADIDPVPLDKLAKFDYKLVEGYIELELLRHGSLRYYERNPIMPYLYIFDVSNYIKRNYAPLATRVEALCRHLEATPCLITQLMEKLDKSLPQAAVEISLETFKGFARYYRDGELVALVVQAFSENQSESGLDQDRSPQLVTELMVRLAKAAEMAGSALYNYVRFFESQLEKADQDFAIGAENYAALLKWGERVELPLDRLLQIGLKDIQNNQARLRQVCSDWLGETPDQATVIKVVKEMGKEHPANAEIVSV